MRDLVQPLPSVHCELCGGELLFERIELDDEVLEIEVQVFVCAKCHREYSRKLIHDPYTAHTLRRSGGMAHAMGESARASRAAIQELTKAYQELATKNAKNLTDAMQALAAVKSPAEFMELQQRLIKEGVEAAVSDTQHIAQLTTAVFTAAFEPVKKQIEAVQKTARA